MPDVPDTNAIQPDAPDTLSLIAHLRGEVEVLKARVVALEEVAHGTHTIGQEVIDQMAIQAVHKVTQALAQQLAAKGIR